VVTRLKKIIQSAKNHLGFRQYFVNTSWLFGEQMLRMGAGLLVGVWVARYLGPDQFGVFSYAIAYAALFGSVAKLGLDSIVVRDLVQEPALRKTYMGTAFWLKIVGALFMLSLVGLASLFTSNSTTTNLYIFIIASGIIFQSFEVVDFYFQSKVLSKFVSICKITQLMISSLMKIYLILIRADLFWFVLVSLVDQITLAISLYIAYRYQKLGSFFGHFDFALAKKTLCRSWPLILSSLVIILYMRVDQIMIHDMLGAHATGIYSVAVRLSEIWYFIPMIVTNSLFPAIVNAKKTSHEQYILRLQRLFTVLVWMSIFSSIVTLLLSKWLVLLLFGVAYQEASQVLMINMWASVFVSLGVASSSWLVCENLQRNLLYRSVLGLIINVLLNFALIPRYGIVGAAYATLFAQSLACLFFDLATSKTRMLFKMKVKTILFSGLTRGKLNVRF
jgi:O-antigen/teichoic acid export membrane protein